MGLGSFAHLLGGWTKPKGAKDKSGKGARHRAKKGDGKETDESAEGGDDDKIEAADDDGEEDDGSGEDDGSEEDAAGEGDDSEDDGADDKDEKPAAAIGKARRQAIAGERKRCAKIFGDKSAANNIAQACELAFGTNLSADRVIAIMATAKPARGGGLADAMAGVNVPPLANGGGGTGGGKEDDAAAAMINTMRKAGMIPPANKGGK